MLRRNKTLMAVVSTLLFAFAVSALAGGESALRRAEEARERGDHSLAAGHYARAAKFLFWRKDLYEQAGISAAQAGEFSNAVGYFEQGSDFSEDGWVWFCAAHIELESYLEAISTCREGAGQFDSPRLYGLLAYIHRNLGDWEAERAALGEQTRLDASDAFAAYRLGLLSMLFSPGDALPELTRASTLNPEVDSAVQTLRAARAVSDLQSDPSMKKVIVGQAFGLVEEWLLAQAAFEQAAQLDQNNAEAWAWLGEAKQQTGQGGSAELDRALSLGGDSVNVRALRALYWSRQGKYEQMLAEYLLAAGIEPENPRWQAGLGDAYAKLGDLVNALESYQRATDIEPGQPEYWRLLALFCAENNAQAEEIGLPAAQKAYELAPRDAAVLDTLGYVYLTTGRYANAEIALTQALEMAPEYFPAYIHLALTYLAQGNREKAFAALTYVRDAPGADAYAETARQYLEKYFP
jgi:tetratricopeptide (TPR) repeat protein